MAIPRDRSFDGTLAMLSDPYRFISTRCQRNGCDAFATRLMLRRAFCVVGEEAARMFYEPDRFTRRGALPVTALTLLQDRGSAQTLDATAHRHRKRMLMSLMTPASVEQLVDAVETEWHRQAQRWETMREVVLVTELQAVLTRAVCTWAGLSLDDAELARRTRELSAMYEGAGAVGPRNWRAQLLRARTERWLRGVVEEVRAGISTIPAGSPVATIAHHIDHEGKLLDARHAAVEIVNLLRPTVAVERFLTFAVLALHEHPECRERLAMGNDAYVERFVQEVRRFYPFFHTVGGRARMHFQWRGHQFAPGDWVLLDMYGTNHDPRTWEVPDEFRPERHLAGHDTDFALIPQGGGDRTVTHRCAGEPVTIEIMKRVTRLFASSLDYELPPQDLTIDMTRMPAVPRSRFRMRNVRLRVPVPVHASA
jgi:fatty-acid peroxygenase